jgi:sterol desaturase/sphingolipid hydroxylase (fatty acid hydroxylase superfamily)
MLPTRNLRGAPLRQGAALGYTSAGPLLTKKRLNTLAPPFSRITIPRSSSALLLAFCLLGTAALLFWPLLLSPIQDLCVATNLVSDNRCATGPNKLLGYIAMIAAFPAVAMLERFWPAAKSQSVFSIGLLVDFIWFCFAPVLLVAVVLPAEDALRWVYSSLGLGQSSLLGSLPLLAQIVVVTLLSDFMAYLAHVVRHKSSFVWKFHSVHHAQEELNYFSTVRLHPIDEIAIIVVRFLPFAMLEPSWAVPAFAVWATVSRVYTMFTHSNVRTNLGPLKYVLVTPQSHRVHHSGREEHQDKNFGNMFAIWDLIFGTQVLDFDVYPETGIKDKNMPRPAGPGILDAFTAYGKMLLYPFSSLRRR